MKIGIRMRIDEIVHNSDNPIVKLQQFEKEDLIDFIIWSHENFMDVLG